MESLKNQRTRKELALCIIQYITNCRFRKYICTSSNQKDSACQWGEKFKSGIIDLQCDVDGKDLGRKSSNGMFSFDTYLASINLQHCSYTNTSEDSI